MRKNKIFNVDTTKFKAMELKDNPEFYSRDTDAFLTFTVPDESFEFDKALLYLINIDDGSVVTEIDTQILGQANVEYEITPELMAHYGRWRGQIVFEKDGEKASSAIFDFVIKRFLTDERPPTLNEIVSLEKLRNDARELMDEVGGLIDDITITHQEIELAEADRASAEAIRVTAEQVRQTGYASMQTQLANKADKKATAWVTATLLNGFTGEVKYRINDANQLEIIGALEYLEARNNGAIQVFTLPRSHVPPRLSNASAYSAYMTKFEIPENTYYSFRTAKLTIGWSTNMVTMYHGGGGTKWEFNTVIPMGE